MHFMHYFYNSLALLPLCRPLQSMVLLLNSQRQYIFDYDSGDRLSAVTMPSVARHTMQTIRSIGYYRNMYTPPESNASVTVDYSEDGQVGSQFENQSANFIIKAENQSSYQKKSKKYIQTKSFL